MATLLRGYFIPVSDLLSIEIIQNWCSPSAPPPPRLCLLFPWQNYKCCSPICFLKLTELFFYSKEFILETRCVYFYIFVSEYYLIKLQKLYNYEEKKKYTNVEPWFINWAINKMIVRLSTTQIAVILTIISVICTIWATCCILVLTRAELMGLRWQSG
jgi:hypothetical protein